MDAKTLDEKIGQLLVAPICPKLGDEHVEKALKSIKENHIGSVIFMAGTAEKQLEIIGKLREIDPNIWIFQDAEWGPGMRLSDVPPLKKNIYYRFVKDTKEIEEYGQSIAGLCKSVGVQCPLAPVVDVDTNPFGSFLSPRIIGTDSKTVAEKSLAVMRGMQKGGVLTCAKHFPGHGATKVDSHFQLPEVTSLELEPFKVLIDAGVDMVMVGHLICREKWQGPATLSQVAMKEILRKELGFKGLIITDSLNMGALNEYSNIYVKALEAGANLLLFAHDEMEELERTFSEMIPQAVKTIKSQVSEKIIDEKVERIIEKKAKIAKED